MINPAISISDIIGMGSVQKKVGILFRFPVPLTVTSLCGHTHVFKTLDSLKRDTPCTCEDPDCWFVKWEEVE